MFYLFITILLNVVISAFFKLFPKYHIDALQAIVVNYWICVITGCLFIGQIPFNHASFSAVWLPWSVLMGLAFISIFNLLAYSTKKDGITTTIIANKLSLVIPVLFSVLVYKEALGVGKVAGIALAFPAIYLTSKVQGAENKPQNLFWPVLLFVSSGLLDTLVKFVQCHFLSSQPEQAIYAIFCFATAALAGSVVVLALLLAKKATFAWKNVIAGICVGIPNYFSIYYLIRMLQCDFLQSSAAIPVLNIGILVASSIVAIMLFGEKANTPRMIGLTLSVIAILLIAFGDK